MFTGIIKDAGSITHITELEGGREFSIQSRLTEDLSLGQSISLNGVCHTVTQVEIPTFSVQSVDETLRKTSIGSLQVDDIINLEPSLHPGQLLDGHLVQGHVDATGRIASIHKEGTDYLFKITYDEQFKNLVVGRGSITVDGISLTVARTQESSFIVAIIPYTFNHSNLCERVVGDAVNLEFDIIGKYVSRHLNNRDEP